MIMLTTLPGFLPGIFRGGAKSVITQIFILFSDQILEGGQTASGGGANYLRRRGKLP